MIPLIASALGLLAAALHFRFSRAGKSRLRRPSFLLYVYRYLFSFAIGVNGLYYTATNLYYAWQLTQSSNLLFCQSLQFLTGITTFALAVTGLLAPFASRGFRCAVLTIYSLQTISAALCLLCSSIIYDAWNLDSGLDIAYGLIVPVLLIFLYNTMDKFNIFNK